MQASKLGSRLRDTWSLVKAFGTCAGAVGTGLPTTIPTALAWLCLALGCNVSSPENTGGSDAPAGACGRGVVVINTDYQSTNVSLVSVDGQVLSSSFISSASGATGLSAPLGGDVVAPSQWQNDDEIVLLDRYPASVVTWVDVASAEPTGQLSAATGYAANPRDFLRVSPNKAYLTRYDPNMDPGQQPFDAGSDILVINPTARSIEGRIDMQPAMAGAPDGFFARPDKLLRVGNRVLVLLGGYAADFVTSVPSRLAILDPETDGLLDTLSLDGFHGCTTMALSPVGDEVAVACSGEFAGDSVTTLPESGIVLVSVGSTLEERRRFPAAKFETGPVGGAIAYTSDTRLVFTTFGQFAELGQAYREDALVQLEIDSGQFEVALRSDGEPFSLGDVRCAAECRVCFLADAKRDGGVLHRFALGEGGRLGDRTEVVVDRAIGLPPRNLGWF